MRKDFPPRLVGVLAFPVCCAAGTFWPSLFESPQPIITAAAAITAMTERIFSRFFIGLFVSLYFFPYSRSKLALIKTEWYARNNQVFARFSRRASYDYV